MYYSTLALRLTKKQKKKSLPTPTYTTLTHTLPTIYTPVGPARFAPDKPLRVKKKREKKANPKSEASGGIAGSDAADDFGGGWQVALQPETINLKPET